MACLLALEVGDGRRLVRDTAGTTGIASAVTAPRLPELLVAGSYSATDAVTIRSQV
jgi:hypothetical protein